MYGSYPLRIVNSVLALVLVSIMMVMWRCHHLWVIHLSYTRSLRVADHQKRLRAIYITLMSVLLHLLIIILIVFLLTGAREVVNDHIFPGLLMLLLLVRHVRSSPRELCNDLSIQLLACHYQRVHFLTVLP
jgi:hypothetical protein